MNRKRDKKGRFLPIHGGYSQSNVPRIKRYLTSVRRCLIRDLGGKDRISTAQWILIDAVVNMLSVCRAVENHVKDRIMHGDDVAPSLGKSYLAYRNSIQRHLKDLGIDPKEYDSGPTLEDAIAEIYRKREAEEKEEEE
jgi:hypothetical protein